MTEKKNVQCTWQERVIDLLDFLKQEGLSPDLLDGIREFNAQYPTPPELQNRIPQPRYHYYGKDVWEAAVAAILCGENLLLAGSKATGKNVLAENLAQVFARPAWDVSFHVNMDAASLIGMDTFEGGEVRFRPGPPCTFAQSMVALACSTRSTWQKMRRLLYCTRRSTSAAPSMFPATSAWRSIPPRASSAR